MKHYANYMLEVTFFREHSALSVSAWEEVKAISAVRSKARQDMPCHAPMLMGIHKQGDAFKQICLVQLRREQNSAVDMTLEH